MKNATISLKAVLKTWLDNWKKGSFVSFYQLFACTRLRFWSSYISTQQAEGATQSHSPNKTLNEPRLADSKEMSACPPSSEDAPIKELQLKSRNSRYKKKQHRKSSLVSSNNNKVSFAYINFFFLAVSNASWQNIIKDKVALGKMHPNIKIITLQLLAFHFKGIHVIEMLLCYGF